MKTYLRRKWLIMTMLTVGTTFQLTACREEFALFGLRTAFSSITLPINTLIRQILLSFA